MQKARYKLTVFTATYNRAHLIGQLYNSLCRQTKFDFEWLVVDDGSTDGTETLFSKWLQEEHSFPIRYYKQENGGLIRALNRGIELAQGEYFAKIDSDDFVTDDFSEKVMLWLDDIADAENVYAVSGVRVRPDGTPIKGVWPTIPEGMEFIEATDLERAKYNLDADMCEAWRTDILRQYPFPVWKGEKFAPEQIVFHEIALAGWKIRWYSHAMSICEYQEGGLTLGASNLEKRNPMGYAMMYNHKLKYAKGFFKRFRIAMQCNALAFVGGYPKYILKSNALALSILALIPGWLLSLRRRKQYKKI